MENQEQIVVPTPIKDVAPINADFITLNNTFCDCQTQRILKRLLSGRFGKLTSLFTYLYQSLIVQSQNPRLYNALISIYQQELLHASLLGSALVSFGGNPRFSAEGTFWNARRVNYTQNPSVFLQENIRFIENSINLYQNAILRVTNQSLKQLLSQILEQDKRHLETFRSFL